MPDQHDHRPSSSLGRFRRTKRDRDGQSDDDLRLARWVQAVAEQWRVRGVSGRDLAERYAALVHELVVARTLGIPTDQIVGIDPGVIADQLDEIRPARRTAGYGKRFGQAASALESSTARFRWV